MKVEKIERKGEEVPLKASVVDFLPLSLNAAHNPFILTYKLDVPNLEVYAACNMVLLRRGFNLTCIIRKAAYYNWLFA
jgi:hypothetical protein